MNFVFSDNNELGGDESRSSGRWTTRSKHFRGRVFRGAHFRVRQADSGYGDFCFRKVRCVRYDLNQLITDCAKVINYTLFSYVVPRVGVEPTRGFWPHRFLRPTRLPIPPPRRFLIVLNCL